LLFACVLCAIFYVVSLRTRRITPAHPEVSAAAEGSFQRDGQYPGATFANAVGVRAWGSWSGSDENVGTLALGPFSAPRILRFAVGGYPNSPGNTLRVERVDTSDRRVIEPGPVGERWRVVDFELPSDWLNHPVRIVATDDSKILGGWLSITEPIRGGRGDGNNALIEALAVWIINGLLLGVIFCAALRTVLTRSSLAPHWIPLGAAAIVATCGYVAFWAYFANALLGVVVSWTILAVGLIGTVWPDANPTSAKWGPRFAFGLLGRGGPRTKPDENLRPHLPAPLVPAAIRCEVTTVLMLLVAVGAFHLSVLHLFPSSHDFYTLAANRFRDALPVDNVLPHTAAERLFASESLKNPADEWLASDRPPLQSGWQLLTWPVSKLLNLDRRTASGTSAVWLQLLWIAAAYGLLRTFAVSRARAAGWIAAFALCGFFLQNTTFTWPKLSAGAFACGAFGLLFLQAPDSNPRSNGRWAALFAGLAWLSHGGVAFSFLPLLPVLAWRAVRGEWRPWLPGAAIFMALVLPWLAFQKLYDPPANRLLKWHLAGHTEKDTRGTWDAMRESYAKLGWREAWSNKISNFHGQVFGDWRLLADVSATTVVQRRHEEFFHPGRALTWWPILALLAITLTRRRILTPAHELIVFTGWLLLTIIVWCLLMFGAYTASIHQGSYAVMIGLFVLFSVLMERAGGGWLAATTVLQSITFATTWAVASQSIHGPATGLPFVIATGAVLGWMVVRANLTDESTAVAEPARGAAATRESLPASGSSTAASNRWQRCGEALGAWWQNPRLNFWVLAVFALLLALRKPHALHTPQLWAEDGSIFLMQADLHGASALTMPYMGYLHTLPRVIAWAAPRLLDPAWWPAFYNGVSFVIWLAVVARFFTRRFDLPGKPWLALALIATPHTGEIFFNVTNLQWLTAFVLIQQLLIAPPKTVGERVSDLTILAMVTLTGPFGIAFLPLFAWRWWRDQRRDNAIAFALVVACAAIQAWFVIRTGPRFEFQSEPLRLWPNLVVLARRLVIWPVLGREAALGFSPGLIVGVGGGFLVAVIAWALRPHALRPLRGQIVAALALITMAGMYRTRPDTWAADNLAFGDRYFYIPRVLGAWLLILEFNSAPRLIASIARVVCLAAVVVHVREFTLRAPPDYHWASQVEPIRHGIRADIPILPDGWTLEYRGRPERKDE
jgi:hypothetical protein